MCGCGTMGWSLAKGLSKPGGWWDLMISKVFSNLNDSASVIVPGEAWLGQHSSLSLSLSPISLQAPHESWTTCASQPAETTQLTDKDSADSDVLHLPKLEAALGELY